MVKAINEPHELLNAIEKSKGLVVYFYNDSCAPCIALRPKIKRMIDEDFNAMELLFVNSIVFPELSASFKVFSSPTIIIFFEGKENFRVSKFVSIADLSNRIDRYYKILFSNNES
ncbi:MAG: thioredoxin family protein [Omnitrophica WOR_2 bacterium]|jgi:thioredoxin-like negative regulator of GroEL